MHWHYNDKKLKTIGNDDFVVYGAWKRESTLDLSYRSHTLQLVVHYIYLLLYDV